MDEIALLPARIPGDYYILILSYNGAYSPEPYHLQAITSTLPISTCTTTDLYPSGLPMDVYTGAYTSSGGGTAYFTQPRTLILLNKQRMDAAHGITETAAMVEDLKALADDATVQGIIVPVENTAVVSDAYAIWDDNACLPETANDVAQTIRDDVIGHYAERYPSLRYLVVVGDDRLMPFYRVSDAAKIANESAYALQAGFNKYDNPVWAALAQGYILSDDYYADRTPLLWRGRELPTPDLAIGRLVETPAEIATAVETFLVRGGLLYADSGLVTGYDFLIDSAEAISDTLGGGGLTLDTLIDDTWDRDDLEQRWLEKRQDVASINAHFDHRNAFPADESRGDLTSQDVLNATASLSGTLNFSMGCHSGYNVPDNYAQFGYKLDFAQVMARRGGWWVANTGFGYGMDDSIAFTEKLMHLFSEELAQETGVSVGYAMQRAKQRYLSSAPSGGFGTYDEKALIEATLYGLPMYRVSIGNAAAEQGNGGAQVQATGLQSMATAAEQTASSPGVITQTFTISPSLELLTGTFQGDFIGNYYAADGQTQGSPGRPVQPLVGYDLPAYEQIAPRGLLFLSGRSTVHTDFDPLISRPVTDTALSEPEYEYEGWFPAKPFAINQLGERARLALVPARYSGDEHRGVQEVFERMTFAVYYAPEIVPDTTGPVIWEIQGQVGESGDSAAVRALVQDPVGVGRVIVTYRTMQDDSAQWQSAFMVYNEESGYWESAIPAAAGRVSYFVQAVDRAGNTSMSANKGVFFDTGRQEIYLPLVMREG